MTLKLYNTISRKKETFKPLDRDEVGLYTCGPTVYNYAHLGNFRAYVLADVLKRYLEFSGYKVKHVMNLTDVDDKTIRDSQKADMSLKQFTEIYAKAFFQDLKILNIEPADVYPKATEYIQEIVDLVKVLLKKGYAYKGEDGSIYYDVSKFKDYGKLAKIDIKKLKSGARINQDNYTKNEANDFALWKAWNEGDGNIYWDTELGKGRPGWHIECSAMSMKYLGNTFDIHAGGTDLVFPHHQNEIAQSEAATGKQFARYWFHNEWLLINGQKMSKSLGNFFTLRDLLEKGYKPKAIRYLLMSAHYRNQLNFTEEELKNSERTVDGLLEFMNRLKTTRPKNKALNEKLHFAMERTVKEFTKYMDDDLNLTNALAEIFDLINKVNKAIDENQVNKKNLAEAHETMMKFDKVLGILKVEKEVVSEKIKKLLKLRDVARDKKDFKKSDNIRAEIRKLGWEVQDTPSGQKIRKRL